MTDFLLALLAPALSKCLEVCFLTGFATAHSLECSRHRVKGGVSQLAPPRRQKVGKLDSPPRTVPNDPDREGNIWLEYEVLKKAHQELEDQVSAERASHKKELNRLEALVPQARTPWRVEEPAQPDMPPLKRPEDKTSHELARELSETKNELERLVVEMSDAHNQVEFLQSEKSVLELENERLRRSTAPVDPGTQRRRSSSSGLRNTPFDIPGPPLNDEGAPKRAQEPMSSFGSDIEVNSNMLPGASRSDAAAKPPPATTGTYKDARLGNSGQAGAGTSVSKLQEENKKLVEENQRLQSKMLKLNGSVASTQDPDVQEKYNRLVEENRRLQSKLLKLDLGGSPQGNAAADSEIMALQSENAELRDDNDKLVNYLENLDKRKKELEDALMNNFGYQQDSARAEQLTAENTALQDNMVRLTSDNAALLDRVERLKARLKESNVLNSSSSFQSIPIPVAVETGDELDKDLWLLVEELRDQNRTLLEERDQLRQDKGRIPEPRTSTDTDTDRQNFTNLLTEENKELQNEVLRLTQRLAGAVPLDQRDVLNDTLRSNERLIEEKREVTGQLKRMLARNQRLVFDNEGLLKQIHSPGNISAKSQASLNKADSRSLLGRFSRTLKKKPSGKDDKLLDTEDSSTGDTSTSNVSDVIKHVESPSKQLVQDLLEENTKLTAEKDELSVRAELAESLKASNKALQEENVRLEESMITMKELQDDNDKLCTENQRLTKRIEECLAENEDLSAKLIDVALQNDEDRIEAALGDGRFSRGTSLTQIDTAALQQKHKDLTKRMTVESEEREGDAVRRKELNSRASRQLQEFAGLRSGPSRVVQASPAYTSPWDDGGNTDTTQSEDDPPPPRLPPRQKPETMPAAGFNLQDYLNNATKLAEESENMSRTHAPAAKEKVNRAFIKHCADDDLGSFMKELGYKGFEPLPADKTEQEVQAVYRRALETTSQIQLAPNATSQTKLLAHSTYEQLQDWFMTYIGGS